MSFASRFAAGLGIVAASYGFSSIAHAQEAPEGEAPPEVVRGGVTNDGPHRQGFTLELGLGAAMTHTVHDSYYGGGSNTGFGIAPLSLSVGGFVSPKVALLARIAGTSSFETRGDSTAQMVNGFYGAHVQYWISDEVMISGGPGLTIRGQNSWIGPTGHDLETGYGASVRVAYSFFNAKHHSVRFAVEAFPSVYKHDVVLGTALNLEWQYF